MLQQDCQVDLHFCSWDCLAAFALDAHAREQEQRARQPQPATYPPHSGSTGRSVKEDPSMASLTATLSSPSAVGIEAQRCQWLGCAARST